MMTPEQAVFAAILGCLAGAGITLPLARWRTPAGVAAFLVTAASAALASFAAIKALSGATPPAARGRLAAWSGLQALRVDGLSAMFLLLTAAVALAAALYSIRCLRRYPGTVARYYPYFLLFVAAIYGLVSSADTGWWLLVFWQLMVVNGYALIRFDRAAGAAGANRFAIMLELACAALLAGGGLAARGGHSAPYDTLAVLLVLLGFGMVMGLWPFGQLWLPHASAAAPAPIAALFAGVMVNLGVYGVLRSFLFVSPAGSHAGLPYTSWGMILAVWGTVTLFAGTLQGWQQEHCRRLLAFHSIGQMGYVLLAVGTCMAVADRPGVTAASIASFALLAGLFHTVNHSLFASLLHFNAGSVMQAAGTQDLNRLGGLMKYMPLTGLTALVGSLSISGVPLFNGFASKWAIFAAAIQGAGSARYLAVCAAVAIVTSVLTLASFIKFFGTTFLSRTSTLVSEKAGLRPALHGAEPRASTGGDLEVGWSMQAPQVLLALVCVLFGLLPGLAMRLLQQAAAITPRGVDALLAKAMPAAAGEPFAVSGPQAAALYAPLVLLGVLAATLLIAYGISRVGSAPRRAAAPWLCGYAREADCHRYAARNFYDELKRPFRWLGGPQDGKAAVVKGRTS